MTRRKASIFHDLKTVLEKLNDPTWLKKKGIHRTAARVSQLLYKNPGINYIGQDWDNLIVLDACRADLFEEVIDTNHFDSYKRVHSNASLTAEWVEKNLADREMDDTVCVSANPHVSIRAGDSFYNLVEVWTENFDWELYTVLPEHVTEAAIKAYEPDKRLIVHYLQPHQPYYTSDLWAEMREEIVDDGRHSKNPLRELQPRPWKRLKDGRYSRKEFWDAYKDTLKTVFPYVTHLIEAIDGRTVVTSDHGELFGEHIHPLLPCGLYGHPTSGLRLPEVTSVPWAIVDGERRMISPGNVTKSDEWENGAAEERLAHLGYK